jgi:23S rRNA pseudouridine1911/1915/1917 synthase
MTIGVIDTPAVFGHISGMSARPKKSRFEFPKARGRSDRVEFTVCSRERDRLDQYLTDCFNGYSRTFLQSLIRSGKVLVGGRKVKPSHAVNRGDAIAILLDTPGGRQPEDLGIVVLHEDDDILVINKAAGMVVHPARGNLSGTIFNGLLFRYRDQISKDPDFHLGNVHRLDENTSGVMVYGRKLSASQSLTEQFENRRVSKEYLAIVHGVPASDVMECGGAVGHDPENKFVMAVDGTDARAAYTLFRLFDRCVPQPDDAAREPAAVVRAFPRTGRPHQIRVHLKHLGHPVVGDVRYGGHTATASGAPLIDRQALHARRLSFNHPGTKEDVSFTAPVPEDMLALADRLGLKLPE